MSRAIALIYCLVLAGCMGTARPSYLDVNHPANPAAPEVVSPTIDQNLHPYSSTAPTSAVPTTTVQANEEHQHHHHALVQ